MFRLPVKFLSATAALFLGSGLTSVYALTETDFTNTGVVYSNPDQFEINTINNTGTVLVQPKGLTVSKVADTSQLSTPTQAGDVISYTVTLDNIGLLPLTGVNITDSIIPAPNMVLTSGDTNGDSVLDGDEIWVFTGTYAVTQTDIDSFGGGDGDIDNVVTVATNELEPISDSATVTITQAPRFAVRKSVDKALIDAPTTLSYTIEVENTGNQALTGVALVDTLPDASVGALTGPTADTGIANAIDAGETWTYTGQYLVSQSEIDAGAVLDNVVSVTTIETQGDAQTANATTSIETAAAMQVSKVVDRVAISDPTDLNYTITVANSGNVTLNNVSPVDTLPDGTSATLVGPIADTGIIGALDVGESWTYTTSYSVSQADIDTDLPLVNTVDVTSDETGSDEVSGTASTQIESAPAFTVTKTVDVSTLGAPDTLNYVIAIENTGNVSLNNVIPVDTLPNGSTATLVGPSNDTGSNGQLDVGETWEFTTSYTVSQAEIDEGLALINQVDVVTDETGAEPISDTAQTTLTRNPALAVSKTVDLAAIVEPGVLQYEISLTNTGNTSLTNIVLADTMPDGTTVSGLAPLVDTGLADILDVDETWVFNTQYTVTQSDIDAGTPLVNSVEVSTEEVAIQSDIATTTVSQTPAIVITKASDAIDFTAIGDTLNYTIAVVNTGNLALSNIVVADVAADSDSLSCTLAMPFSLQPGEQINCSATRTVTAEDIGVTTVQNQATVSSVDPSGNSIDAVSNTVVTQLLRIPPVATDNVFDSPVSAVAVTLQGAADDTDLNGDLDVSSLNLVSPDAVDLDGDGDNDSLVLAGVGAWLVDDVTGEVQFTPELGGSANPQPIQYTVSDATGLVSNVATLTVTYPQSAPVAEDDVQSNPAPSSPTNPTTVFVLADNGNGADSDPENNIDVLSVNFIHADAIDSDADGDNDSLTVAGEGLWVVDNATGSVTFTPIAGFLLDPTPIFYTIADTSGLVSNEALITIDYPQTAPIANDDEKLDQPLGKPVSLAVLANDVDAENNLDATTVRLLDPATDEPVLMVTVLDEGTWTIDEVTGDITFTPMSGFIEAPTPVMYSVKDTTELESNLAQVTVSYEQPAALEGIVWLDSDRDGLVGASEELKVNWTLRVFDTQGELVAITTTDANGFYRVEGLIPGEYTVEFYNEADVFMDSQSSDGPIEAGQLVNLPLPVDPGGVVYDSVSRVAVSGVSLNLINGNGQLLDESCLRQNQQSQVTQADGLYSFKVNIGAHETCPNNGTYRIEIAEAPASYRPNYSNIIRQEGAQACGDATLGCAVSETFDAALQEANCTIDTIPNSNACEIQVQPTAPQVNDDTRYFVEFFLAADDQSIVFNHIPIDARDNDAQILLSKAADQRTASRGSIVQYTLTASNAIDVPALDISVVDSPPANFALVEESIRLVRAGDDGELGTEDDSVTVFNGTGQDPIEFNAIDLDPLETVNIRYLMRVGVGVVAGDYTNTAFANGPNGIASNEVSATVEVVADPVLEQATLVGKVFIDRDEDGIQDPADATGVFLGSDYYGWNSLALPTLPGRNSVTANPSDSAIIVNMPLSGQVFGQVSGSDTGSSAGSNSFMVSTSEGTRINVDHEGNISEAHIGAKARGLTGQDIRVCTQYTVDVPTNRQGLTPSDGEPTDVLRIVIENYGVNEIGIPGARLATVTGLLIETDAYGRYSVPDVDAGTTGIGQNFVLKVDAATLPQGSTFTTENPYVLRIVNSSLNKINFGILVPENDAYAGQNSPLCAPVKGESSVAGEPGTPAEVEHRTVEVTLGSVFFNTDQYDVREDQKGIVSDIVTKLREFGGGTVLIEANTDSSASAQYNIELAERRATTIRRILEEKLGSDIMRSVLVDVNPEAYQEQEQ